MISMGSLECVGLIHASPSSTSKSLQERVKGLEEERKKIEAFKRELPLCMQLLNHAIEASKERLGVQKPSLLKIPPDFQAVDSVYPTQRHPHRMKDKQEKAIEEDQDNLIRSYIKERNPTIWTPLLVSMGSQQQSLEKERFVSSDGKVSSKIQRPHEFDQTFGSASKPKLGGAFSPFQKKRKQVAIPKSESAKDAVADLTLGPSSQGSVDCRKNCSGKLGQIHGPNIKKGRSKDAIMVDLDQQSKERTTSSSSNCLHHTGAGLYPQKKGRRCWSPELHSTFLNALHELGGPQVATPKQIKELMKVEGLTNDEVKSHLQKYRLHMRRPSPTQQSAASTPQLVHVVGGIWMPPLIPPQHPMPPPTLVYTHPNLHLCHNPINPTIAQVYHEGHQASPMGLSSSEAQAHSMNEGIEGNGGETSSSQQNSQPIDCEEEEEDEEEELRDTQDSCANQLCAGSSTTNY